MYTQLEAIFLIKEYQSFPTQQSSFAMGRTQGKSKQPIYVKNAWSSRSTTVGSGAERSKGVTNTKAAGWSGILPSGYVKIAIENGHRNSEFSH